MKENKEKENPNPSRMRGRGVEVSKTLFYCKGKQYLATTSKIM